MSCSDDTAISVNGVGKFFEIYEKPVHRLLQMLFRGRRRYYRPFWALSDISFTVGRGECVGIIGRNGAGKSTLLQIITGTLSPSAGEVYAKGRVAALLELGSGFNPEFTGRENVYLNASILGLNKQEIDVKYEDIVAFADIGEFIGQPVKSYSSGMVVRLAFAVVAHVDADVLIVDEALAVGDAFFTQKCMRFLRNFMKEHTVLFVSHDVAAVNSLCNRAILLEAGHIKMLGSPKDVTEKYLEDMYESIQGQSAPLDAFEDLASHEDKGRSSDPSASSTMPFRWIGREDLRDMRQDFINCSNLRNDIQVFRFNEDGASFGKGGVRIENTSLLDEHGCPLSWVVGGEMVTLQVQCLARQELFNPIVGFHIKNRLGQALTGDNTYLAYLDHPLAVPAGRHFCAAFTFRMPILDAGDYSITVAVAEGSQEEHVQHQWQHDGVMLTSVSTSVATGIMGVPMREISLGLLDDPKFDGYQRV